MPSLNRVFCRLSAVILTLLLSGGSLSPVFAQHPAQEGAATTPIIAANDGLVKAQGPSADNESAPQSNNVRQEPRAVDLLPTDRVGVDKNKVMKLALHDAILMALSSNIDIEVERGNVQIAQFNLAGSHGVYDPLLGASLNFNSAITPTAQTFIGAQGGSYNSKSLTYNFNLNGYVNTGGSYSVIFNNNRQTSSAGSAGLNPQYNSSLQFQYTQPLMRNFRFSQNERGVLVNKKQLTLSDSAFRQKVISTIAGVQSAYWDLVYAIRNNDITRESVELADVTLHNNQRQVEVGTLAPIEIVSAKADLESRKDAAISALQQVTVAENVLKTLMLGDPASDNWAAVIAPTEQVEFTALDIDLNAAVDSALKNRPELEQLHLQQELKGLDLKYYRLQQKPQVDFVTTYTLSGLAGAVNTPKTPTSSIPGSQLNASILAFNQQLGQPVFVPLADGNTPPQSGIPSQFIGGYGRALGNLFSFDFHTYSFGVNFSFPLRNRTAKAQVGRTLAEGRQLEAQERKLRQTILVDVRNAVQNVVAARQRVEAARAGRIAAEAQLKGEEQKFAAGIGSNFLVLDRQNRLSTARGLEIRALTDYNKGISDLQRAMSTTLAVNGIQVSAPSQENSNTTTDAGPTPDNK